ncbi:hypothetical protein [Nocardia arthritidis]|uniref:Uncharacterized protein n=1 Tax=Nocardia arthritidis TaxID=228602 RepID=A0A6G9YTA8_9NOCA|nr:hypothetical protein [Nocardia arthritidis]QIS16448.1 hypothetical protein F5544_43205 [Nocardia arthritidis]
MQAKISESDYPLAARLTTMQAHRIASVKREANARFSSQIKYSAEDIKNALSGETLWSELIDDMTAGLDSLRIRNPDYAAAIEARYLGMNSPRRALIGQGYLGPLPHSQRKRIGFCDRSSTELFPPRQ